MQEDRPLQERSRDARRRILDAAVAVLVDHGYAGATTTRIQERAGVSRGRLLHHYPSRDALLIAACHHLATVRVEAVALTAVMPDDPAERIATAVATMAATYRSDYFWAATELWVASRTHPDLAAQLLPHEQELARAIRAATDGFFGPDLVTHPGYEDLRETITTSLRGLHLATAFDPRPTTIERHEARLVAMAHAVLLGGPPSWGARS
ncbi:TetR family transcriptional regulator [Nocardioides zeae]|uniref:TetR/AcrR family transcriptional regulator n=1 Tax=Nocardioides zeae TaxID=1457234 RepID=A0A6P0HLH8_9ACTN|nr:TetR/AcrR family transcriptional regulator [Nocardioides zeae]